MVRLLALLALLGCDPSAVSIEVDGPAVVARWTATTVESRVEVRDASGTVLWTDWQEPSSNGHEALLLGLSPGQSYTAVAAARDGLSTVPSAFDTEPLPTDFPTWSTEGTPGWEGFLVGSLLGDTSNVVVMNDGGEVVWYHEEVSDTRVIRARPRVDGRGLWYAAFRDTDETAAPELVSVDWRGQELYREAIDHFTHDFVEHQDGTLGLLLEDLRPVDGYEGDVRGNSVVQFAPGEAPTTVFSTWDIWEPGPDGQVHDGNTWTHGNALDWDEDTRCYTVGFRGQDALVEVSADSGEVRRQVGGPTSTYTFVDGAQESFDQHQFQWVTGGVLIFDNGVSETGSRAVEFGLDDEAGTATERWSYQHDPALWVYALGDVDRASDGSTLVTFSTAGVIDDVTADGDVRWSLTTGLGTVLGYTTRVTALPGVSRAP